MNRRNTFLHTQFTTEDRTKQAQNSRSVEHDVFAIFIQGGGHIESHEWIDTLTEPRKQWNAEHPDNPIPLDL